MIMQRLNQRCLRYSSRQLHTIISQETIKPSSPTPLHLKTHNLSLIDQLAANVNMPFIFFYKSYTPGDIDVLKKSLSQTLTSYYPFAGRCLAPSVPQIECNDQGVVFSEASNDNRLTDFVLKKELDETIDELIPNNTLSNEGGNNLVEVQLNRLSCGGAALAVCMSHKVGDGYTMGNFLNHWATITRGETSPKNPTFSSSKSEIKVPEFDFKGTNKVKYATRRFVFPNSKLNELKNKVNASSINPTRVEILSSLIFKHAVDAATTLSGCMHPSSMYHVVNMRNKIRQTNKPEILAGNICTIAVAKMSDCSEITLHEVIERFRKDVREIKEVKNVEEVGEVFLNKLSTLGDDGSRTYNFSSLCRFPFNEFDFGWGKPVQFILKNGVLDGNIVHLLDTPCGEGIGAIVQLGEEEMSVFEKDKEMLQYSQDI